MLAVSESLDMFAHGFWPKSLGPVTHGLQPESAKRHCRLDGHPYLWKNYGKQMFGNGAAV